MRHDLNLLNIFLVIAEERNLTRAGERLSLSQPALSHALKKLRSEFGDPLFVRASRGLVPTPHAEGLLPEVRKVLASAEALYGANDQVELSTVERPFILGATTYFEMRILQPLLSVLAKQAPGVTLETRSLIEGFPGRELEDGRMDLAVAAYFENLPEGFRVRSLGKDPHVCVARKGHPALKRRITLDRYLSATHVKIGVPPGRVSAVDRVLASAGKGRRIVCHFSNFITPALALLETDHLLTCPESLARTYAHHLDVQWCALPLEVPPVEIRMAWHERTHHDPFLRWMRQQIAEAAT